MRGTGIAAAFKYLRANQTLSAFDTELNSYLLILSRITAAQLLAHDPLLFWVKHAASLPILGRLARRFFSAAPTSCNVEAFFSVVVPGISDSFYTASYTVIPSPVRMNQ
jgi:hypothetical protein